MVNVSTEDMEMTELFEKIVRSIHHAWWAHERGSVIPYNKFMRVFNIEQFEVYNKYKDKERLEDFLASVPPFPVADCEVRYNRTGKYFEAKSTGMGKCIISEHIDKMIEAQVYFSPLLKGRITKNGIASTAESLSILPRDNNIIFNDYYINQKGDIVQGKFGIILVKIPFFYANAVRAYRNIGDVADGLFQMESIIRVHPTIDRGLHRDFLYHVKTEAEPLLEPELQQVIECAKEDKRRTPSPETLREMHSQTLSSPSHRYSAEVAGDVERLTDAIKRAEAVRSWVRSHEGLMLEYLADEMRITVDPADGFSALVKAIEEVEKKSEEHELPLAHEPAFCFAQADIYKKSRHTALFGDMVGNSVIRSDGTFKVDVPDCIRTNNTKELFYSIVSKRICFAENGQNVRLCETKKGE